MWPLGLLVGASILALASLYMPWQQASCDISPNSSSSQGLQDLFSCPYGEVDGWSSVGAVAALAALALALMAAAALVWPRLGDRLPLFSLGLGVVYFVVAVVAQTRHVTSQAEQQSMLGSGEDRVVQYHLAYGTFVGIAAAALVLVGIGLGRPTWKPAPRSIRELSAGALTLGLLVALLLPWHRANPPVPFSTLGVANPSGAIAGVVALTLLLVVWLRDVIRALETAGLALVALLFAVATFAAGFGHDDIFGAGVGSGSSHPYGAWAGIAFAVTAALVLLIDRRVLQSIRRPTAYAAAAVGSGAAIVVSLFLPWQTACYGNTADLRSAGVAGRCVSSNGFGLAGSNAALLTIMLAATLTMLPWLRQTFSAFELATGLVLLVATLGFRLDTGAFEGVNLDLGHGVVVGFVATAALVALTLARARWRRPSVRAVVPCLLPMALGVVYIAVVVVPWWGVLPDAVWSTFVPRFAALSWLTLASALIGVRLVFAWWRQARGVDRAPELVLLSLGLVALTVLDAMPLPTIELNWNEALLFALTVPLLLLALVEERGGLRSLRIPEALRVDRP